MAWAGAEANVGRSSGPALIELQPRARAQGHRGSAYSHAHILRLCAVFFAPLPTAFTFVIVVNMSKIPQKWAQQGFLSLSR